MSSEVLEDFEWVDSHCHLNYDYSPKSIEQLVQEAHAARVKTLVTIGAEPASLVQVAEISHQYDSVFHTIGIHPHEAIDASPDRLQEVATLARDPKCRAIGEVGLDYHYEHSPPNVQVARLKDQLRIALELDLPIVIHSREAEEDLLKCLKEYASQSKRKPCGVIHCFSGSQEFAQSCIQLGFYISFSGILTFKNATELREIARNLPVEKMMVETDSPYLAPMPYRGKKCEPAMVVETAKVLAQIKNLGLKDLANITTRNSKQLFNIN